MALAIEELMALAPFAINAAHEAGRLIASRADKPHEVQHKTGGESLASQVVTEVDLQSEAAIVKHLQPTCDEYDIALLTEEHADDGARLQKQAFWCVDPLDGTLQFIESTPGYAVSIALVSRAGVPLIGVIYDPVTGTLYSAIRGQGAWRNGKPWREDLRRSAAGVSLTVACDRSQMLDAAYPEVMQQVESLANRLGYSGVSVLPQGGAVMNACWLLDNAPAVYFKRPKPQQGGGCLWDFAATACLLPELGAVATDFHGHPLELNRAESVYMNHRGVLFATDAPLALALIRQLAESTKPDE